LSLGEHCDSDDVYDLFCTITRLLELGCGDPLARDQWGRTSLHLLVRNDPKHHLNGCIDALLSFVEESRRASYINATDAEGKSAIFYASVHFSSVFRVRKLLDLHADPLVGNPTASSILHSVLDLFESSYDDESTLDLFESSYGYESTLLHTITGLLKLGCGDPMARDKSGRTALHLLLRNDPKFDLNGCINALLSFVDESQRKSFVNATDAEGKSAIFYAAISFSSATRVKKLLDLNADPLVGNPSGSSILHGVLALGCIMMMTSTICFPQSPGY